MHFLRLACQAIYLPLTPPVLASAAAADAAAGAALNICCKSAVLPLSLRKCGRERRAVAAASGTAAKAAAAATKATAAARCLHNFLDSYVIESSSAATALLLSLHLISVAQKAWRLLQQSAAYYEVCCRNQISVCAFCILW